MTRSTESRSRRVLKGLAMVTVLAVGVGASAGEWPRWRGPDLDAICKETGLLKAWPKEGPRLLWQATGLGTGFSSISICGGKIFTMGDLNENGDHAQYVIALDLATQKRLWTAKVGRPHGDGSRCTPTVDGGLVYAIGTDGDLVCVEAATGKEQWRKDFGKDFGGRMMSGWKYSESPLVDGDNLVCTPGGGDAVMVALNKKTGETIWKCPMAKIGGRGGDGAGYSSIAISEGAGVRQYVQITGRGCISVGAKDGKFLWGYNKIANGTANISTPVAWGDYVFCSTAYGTGAAGLKLKASGEGGVSAEEVYFLDAKTFQNHHGGFVRVGEHIYGGHGHGQGAPTCIEACTGKIMWQVKQPGGGSAAVLYADGHLIFRYQEGEVALVEANPKEYKLTGLFKQPRVKGMRGPAWPHPVIVDGKLYLRHADVLLCYDVKGATAASGE